MTMNKSVLTAAVLGVLSVASSGAAFADNASTYCKPGFYAGLSGGRSDTFYSIQNAMGIVAYNNGGINSRGVVGTPVITAAKVDDIGIGGRIYAGYQFNPYLAVEAGYTQYAKTDFSATLRTRYSDGSATKVQPGYTGEITEHAIDVVAKGTYAIPMAQGLGVFVKAGMAFIAADNHINYNGSSAYSEGDQQPVNTNGFSTIYTTSNQGVRPVAGAGIAYTVPNTNLNVGVSYTRVFSYGVIPNAKLASVDVEYKFA